MRKYIAVSLFLFPATFVSAQNFVNGQAARAVIGQTTFSVGNSTPNQQIIGAVSGLAYYNGNLFVADSTFMKGLVPQDNRVLTFGTNQIPPITFDFAAGYQPSNPACWVCGYPASNVLGQPDYTSTNPGTTSQTMQTPTAVATDGTVLAVADTNNNRVLLWKSIPTSIDVPADVVLGQTSFTTGGTASTPTASTMRGPQGVWIQNGKLFVTDTQNYRILIWNQIPTQNGQAADVVLGQTNMTSATNPCPPSNSIYVPTASQVCTGVGISSDGTHLFLADLGFNRVLIWNSIPSSNNQPADVVVGQANMTGAAANNSAVCPNGGGSIGQCAASLNFPRAAISDGTRLFVADGGNDRVLIFNSVPSSNGAAADAVLGQPNFTSDVVSSAAISIVSTAIDNTAAVDVIPTPAGLAFDGTNLYVSDPTNRRILVFTPGNNVLGSNSVLNWASGIIRQEGIVVLSVPSGGSINSGDTVTITIAGTGYTYTIQKSDTLDSIAQGLVKTINSSNSGAGDPNATAIFAGTNTGSVYLSSKGVDLGFDTISLAASTSNSANITATASGGYLSAGTAATASPGMLVEINGSNLSDSTLPIVSALKGHIPTVVAGAEVFMDGIPSPIYSASYNQVVAQVPYSFGDRNSTSVYVRTLHGDNSVTVTNATPVYIAPANPGLFSAPSFTDQPRPWPATGAYHQPGNPTSVVSVDGTVKAGDTVTISVNGVAHTYTVQASDTTTTSIAQGLINTINSANDPLVTASLGGAFSRVVLTARQGGAAGTGIPIATSTSSGASVTLTAYTSSTCCNVTPNSPITPANPAVVGELITLSASGLGIVTDPTNTAFYYQNTGAPYTGPVPNNAINSVSATMGGSTAQVVAAGLAYGSYGVYQVQMIVPTNLSNNAATQTYIAQNAFVSNIVLVPVGGAVQVNESNQQAYSTPITITVDGPNQSTGPVTGVVNAGGWVIDTQTTITSVQVSIDGQVSGQAAYGGNRQDVCNLYQVPGCPNVGWNYTFDTSHLADGSHMIQITATAADGARLTQAASFVTSNYSAASPTKLSIDIGQQNTPYQGTAVFHGWAVNSNAPISSVSVAIDGVTRGQAVYGQYRPDVCAVYAGQGCPNVGWMFQFDTTTLGNGTHVFTLTAKASNGDTSVVARLFTVANWTTTGNPIHISIDSPNAQSGTFSGTAAFGGWALDDVAAISRVSVAIDGVIYPDAAYGGQRQDVCAALPGRAGCPDVGWNTLIDTTQLGDGTHTLVITATPSTGQSFTTTMQFQVANLFSSGNSTGVSIDTPGPNTGALSGMAHVGGWAVNGIAPISTVQISVDGVSNGFALYGGNRADVCAVLGNDPGCPNVGWNYLLNTTMLTNGTHILEATATSSQGQRATQSATFTVANGISNGPTTVTIAQPNAQSNPFLGLATFSGTAGNTQAALSTISITIDGVPFGEATFKSNGSGSTPWSFTVDTTRLAEGTHTLGVTASGSDGAFAVASATFKVANWSTPDPMIVTIDRPVASDGAYVSVIDIGGWAINQNGPISTVSLAIDGVPYGQAAYGGNRPDVCAVYANYPSCPNVGWTASLDTTLLADGTHILSVTATTATGQSSTAVSSFLVGN